MTALGLLLLFLIIACGIGRQALRLTGARVDDRLTRFVFAEGLGLGLIAYLVLVLGLVGLLSRVPVAVGLAVLAAVCWRGFVESARDIAAPGRAAGTPAGPRGPRALAWLAAATILPLAGLALVNCFVPPMGHEWDALSYHLAAPKVYIEHHRIVFLPTDHHSNFPFLVEMLFTLGLLYQGWALANLFHFALAGLCVAGAVALGRRLVPGAGAVAAVVFATSPIVVWEAGAAYIEMGLTLYVLLAAAAAVLWRQGRDARYLVLAGVLMGFALSVKALALAPFALVALLLIAARTPWRPFAAYVGCAIVVGCPFYVKSAVWTGNPVYPYAYRLLGGKYWSQDRADVYSGEQRGFGFAHAMVTPDDDARGVRPEYKDPTIADRLRNLLMVPFGLVAVPRAFYNYNDPGVFSQLGFLFLAVPPLLLLAGRSSLGARWCAALALLWYLVWALTMQYTRYIIPLLPFLGLAGGEGLARLAVRHRWLGWLAGGAVLLQLGLTLSYFGPRLAANHLPRSGPEGVELAAYPGQWQLATDAAARDEFLSHSVDIYGAEQWLNHNTPPDAGVVLFEETRGFYLDRPYLWGNSPHSAYIPYGTFHTGRQMVDWFLAHGIHYALVNMKFAPQATRDTQGAQQLTDAVVSGTLGSLVLEWHLHPDPSNREPWRPLLGQALETGAAVFLPDASSRATAVIQFVPAGGAR